MRFSHSAGYLVVLALVFGSIFFIVVSAFAGFVITQKRVQTVKYNKERAFEIAEAGLDYYKWYLAHFPGDTTNGTTTPGPYVHGYDDPEGGEIGVFSLDVSSTTACGDVMAVDITSTGYTHDEPGIQRTVYGRYARPTVTEYAFIINSNVWAGGLCGDEVKAQAKDLKDGEVLMLENIRHNEGEKKNDAAFAEVLASYADLYVFDAFSVAHRNHASVTEIPKYLPTYAGMLFAEEVTQLSRAISPDHPAIFVLGGAKFDTKMPLAEKFIEAYDKVFIGGALANDFFKARGYEIGRSLHSNIDLSASVLLDHPKLLLPIDVTVRDSAGHRAVKLPVHVAEDETILDAGPATVDMLREEICFAKTVLWNGPLGDYEQGFSEQTEHFAKAVASIEATSIVGGGDTIASIEKSAHIFPKKNL